VALPLDQVLAALITGNYLARLPRLRPARLGQVEAALIGRGTGSICFTLRDRRIALPTVIPLRRSASCAGSGHAVMVNMRALAPFAQTATSRADSAFGS
jgi:hypothetical protein